MGVADQGFQQGDNMKHNNQIHSVRKFRKYWQRYVKTWFNQPARKKSRRMARDKKAAVVAPRPVAGCVRPVGHPPTVKYNSKVRVGRGFSLAEIKAVGLGKLEARSLGIAVDARRRNRSVNGKQANEQRLREYKANLVVFPRNAKKTKGGWKADAAADETAVAEQVTAQKVMAPVTAFVVASTTGDKWLVACVLAATASSDEITFAHVVTGVGLDEVPAVSQRYFLLVAKHFLPILRVIVSKMQLPVLLLFEPLWLQTRLDRKVYFDFFVGDPTKIAPLLAADAAAATFEGELGRVAFWFNTPWAYGLVPCKGENNPEPH